MAESYSSDSGEDCERLDSITLPAPWEPAAAAQRQAYRQIEEDKGFSPLTLPPLWSPAAAPVPRRWGMPPWRGDEDLQREADIALLATAAAVTAAEVAEGGRPGARAASTGALTALEPARSPSVDSRSGRSQGAPKNKPGGWLSTLASQHGPELLRGSAAKFGSAPDFGDVQTRIRAHRPAAAGAHPRLACGMFRQMLQQLGAGPVSHAE